MEAVILCLLVSRCFAPQDHIKIGASAGTIADSDSVQADGQEHIIFSKNLKVKPTAYSVTVNYKSVSDASNPDKKSYDDITGTLIFSLNRHGLLSNNLDLSDGMTTAKTRIWLTTWTSIKDLSLNINYSGKGHLTVQSISLRECMIYRFAKIMCFLVLAVLIDLAYVLLRGKNMLLWGFVGIIVISSLPVLGNSFYYGDDSFFHLHRIISLADSIKSGNIPQRIQLTSMHGYGYASPLFYGELFLVIPAVLYLLCLPLQLCYQIYVVLVNISTCLISYWCAKKVTKDREISLLCSFIYTCSAYRLVNVYQRWAVGEYTALTFLPLVVYGFYHIYMKSDRERYRLGDYFPLVIGLSGIIQTHTLTLEMTAIIIFIFILFHLRETFRLQRFIVLVKTVIVTFLLNAWFLIPMLSSLHQDMYVSNTKNYMSYWPIDPDLVFSILDFGYSGHHVTLGSSMLIGIILFILIKTAGRAWKADSKMMRALNALEGLGILTVIFTTSYIQWDNLYNINEKLGQILSVMQFSWRYFAFATVLLTAGIAVSLLVFKTNTSAAVYYTAVGSLILSTALFASSFMSAVSIQGKASVQSGEPSYYEYYIDNDMPYVGNNISGGEYLPYKVYRDTLATGYVRSDSGVSVSDYKVAGNTRTMYVKNSTSDAAHVSIPLLAYDNYHAYLQNNDETSVESDDTGRVRIQISASYKGTVTVRYVEPVLWRISEGMTLVAAAGLCIYGIMNRRKQRNGLKNG